MKIVDFQLILIQSAFGAYVLTLIGSSFFVVSKQMKFPMVDFGCHSIIILLVARVIKEVQLTRPEHLNDKHFIFPLLVLAICLACFLTGVFVGRSSGAVTESSRHGTAASPSVKAMAVSKNLSSLPATTSATQSSPKPEVFQRRIRLTAHSDSSADLTNSHVLNLLEPGIVLPVDPATLDSETVDNSLVEGALTASDDLTAVSSDSHTSYATIVDKARSTVMSILGLLSYPGTVLGYTQSQWKVVKSGSQSHLWISRSKTDGILLRATCEINSSAKCVLRWLLHHDRAVGIEEIADRKETLFVFRGGQSRIRRFVCKPATLTSSKRDFVFISNNFVLSDGSILVSSRSIDVPDTITPAHRLPGANGHIRGILFGSGFVLRPVRGSSGQSCELFVAVHMDMLGSMTGRVNESKRDALADSIIGLLDSLKGGCTNAFPAHPTADSLLLSSTEADSALEPSAARRHSGADQSSPGITSEQVQEILEAADASARQLRALFVSRIGQAGTNSVGYLSADRASAAAAAMYSATESESRWDTFYNNNGITVSEQTGGKRAVGVLNATVTLEASPASVLSLLKDYQEQIDGMLAAKSTLNRVSEEAFVQWLAYRSIWPLGARDFLLVTVHRSIKHETGDGFMLLSTSIDDICHEVDEDPDEVTRKLNLSQFTRSKLRLAGYVGVPSKSFPGGTDLNLFVDVDAYTYTPAWLVQFLAQYGLAEMMSRIREVTSGHSTLGQATQLTSMLNRIQSWESRLQLFRDDPTPRPGPRETMPRHHQPHDQLEVGVADTSNQGKSRTDDLPAADTSKLTLTKPEDIEPETQQFVSPDMSTRHGLVPDSSASGCSIDGAVEITRHLSLLPSELRGIMESAAATLLQFIGMEEYLSPLALTPVDGLRLDWQTRVVKDDITVMTSVVEGSSWQAVKGTVIVNASQQSIMDLLLDDDRIGEFDDMFDFYKFLVRMDERTVIRRICFKGIWPTSPRDFIACSSWIKLPNGSTLIFTRSASDSYCEQQSGYVRGKINVSGYLVRPLPSTEAGSGSGSSSAVPQCHLTLAAHSELGGTLPSSIVNMLSTTAPTKMLSAIKNIMSRINQ